jgi:hypothetical protein
MKRLLMFFGIFFILCVTVLFVRNLKPSEKSKVLPANTIATTSIPTPVTIKQSVIIDVDKAPIRISWVIANPEEIELYSNLKDQKLSEEIWVNKSCRILVNGGFYSKENTHLGLFVNNFETISPVIKSSLLNSFLWINDDDLTIGNNSPDNNPRIAIQSGPLLFQEGKPLPLSINNDEPSRRIVAAKTDNKQLLFLAFYQDQSEYSGPMLGKLPEILKLFAQETNIRIIDAINLDGGSASVFISNYTRLNELAHIGSYFCTK